ncbi:patatin-like phospholipase family protein [Sphingomonas sp. AOB5]|uniref:patatin-like phospholipase family protein n=1 Tax=Sphingomonas sp. AOB5 TaxID=3034017 RepID=UPI0023F8BE73|nr:patatin-like phospholipase family protein [Sphingomonas sp. AOB5]MDF7775479.1 patatin-like phospholipase family protein [Sphingomonas sp. AOB5]
MAEETKVTNARPDADADSPIHSLREEARLFYPSIEALKSKDDADHWAALGQLDDKDALHALCLSGGGIRSATFCLGILQGLAKKERLEDFHYLSTVSGGGYIGSWLSRWRASGDWSQEKMTEAARIDGGETNHPVRRLRSFSNYLTPNWGLSADAMTVVSIFVRNLLVNLLIWVPLVLIAATIPRLLIAALHAPAAAYKQDAIAWAAFGIPALLGALWAASSILVFFFQPPSERYGERWSRRTSRLLSFSIAWLLWFGAFIYLPLFALRQLDSWQNTPVALSLGGGSIALITALAGYWSRHGVEIKRQVTGFADRIGARLLDVLAAITLAFIALGASLIVHYIVSLAMGTLNGRWQSSDYLDMLDHANVWQPLLVLLAALAATLLLVSLRAGANNFSLHALYGNRLIRAYLGSARSARPTYGDDDSYDVDDDIPMSKLVPAPAESNAPRPPVRLFHVVNMTLNLARRAHNRRDWQERRAASFTATPLRCGSPILGYAPTAHYGGGNGMMLGRAMTISGAAVSPNMGYYGSPLMALVMAFFNVRLGWWLPNPAKEAERKEPTFGLLQILNEGFSQTSADADWLYLSDGGHFDNLGLYEMVRRRCRRIVVIDAGCDGEFGHGELHIAVRKIGVDFGIPIELPTGLPGQKGIGERQRVMVGKIRYSALGEGDQDGEIFCVKPMLTGVEPPALIHYAASSRRSGNTFPHHSTLDQFFDETQFESYRQLGEFTAKDLLAALDSGPERHDAEPAKERTYYPLYVPPESVSVDASSSSSPRPAASEPDLPPPAILRGVGGIAQSIQDMSPVRLLVTTLVTAGGVGAAAAVGNETGKRVAGTVAPSAAVATVRIDPKDLQAVRDGVTVKGVEDAQALLKPMIDEMRKLQEELKKPRPGTSGDPVTVTLDPNVTNQITEILNQTTALQQFTRTVRYVGTTDPGGGQPLQITQSQLNSLLSNVRELVENLKKNPPATREQATALNTNLTRISRQIEALDPRRTTRSQ